MHYLELLTKISKDTYFADEKADSEVKKYAQKNTVNSWRSKDVGLCSYN